MRFLVPYEQSSKCPIFMFCHVVISYAVAYVVAFHKIYHKFWYKPDENCERSSIIEILATIGSHVNENKVVKIWKLKFFKKKIEKKGLDIVDSWRPTQFGLFLRNLNIRTTNGRTNRERPCHDSGLTLSARKKKREKITGNMVTKCHSTICVINPPDDVWENAILWTMTDAHATTIALLAQASRANKNITVIANVMKSKKATLIFSFVPQIIHEAILYCYYC